MGGVPQAFVHNTDYMGVQLVKRLRLLDDPKKQAAEVASYYGNFDEAERIYRGLDRFDLVLELRSNVGDWFKVVQLLQHGSGDDSQLQNAWNALGDLFVERQSLAKAAQHYAKAKNMQALIKCYCAMEDWAGLERVTDELNEGSPLLLEVGKRFAAVGMAEEATAAFIKAGNTKVRRRHGGAQACKAGQCSPFCMCAGRHPVVHCPAPLGGSDQNC